jgi:undecaprenyl-diphosphatase
VTSLVSALLGVVQGLTEFLPVSSTAHLLIGGQLLGHDDPGGVFTTMIQLGSILAVMWLYRRKILAAVVGLPNDPESRRFALMLLVGCVPVLLAGALFGDFIQGVLYGGYGAPRVIAGTFIAGGVLMLVAERWRPAPTVHAADETPLGRALGVGLCQMLALVPGVSRSGATVVGGMLMGLDRPAAAELSFFLSMPTMTAAFAYGLLKLRGQVGADRGPEILIGFVFAFLAALVVVKPFLRYVGRSGFAVFAWYRIAAGLAILAVLAAGWA